MGYPLANKQLDPENHHVLMETSLPTPICQGLVYVNLPEGNRIIRWFPSWGLASFIAGCNQKFHGKSQSQTDENWGYLYFGKSPCCVSRWRCGYVFHRFLRRNMDPKKIDACMMGFLWKECNVLCSYYIPLQVSMMTRLGQCSHQC